MLFAQHRFHHLLSLVYARRSKIYTLDSPHPVSALLKRLPLQKERNNKSPHAGFLALARNDIPALVMLNDAKHPCFTFVMLNAA
jgi:hypothetical protein